MNIQTEKGDSNKKGRPQTEKERPRRRREDLAIQHELDAALLDLLLFQLKLDATLLDLLLRFDINLMLHYLLDLSSDSTFT